MDFFSDHTAFSLPYLVGPPPPSTSTTTHSYSPVSSTPSPLSLASTPPSAVSQSEADPAAFWSSPPPGAFLYHNPQPPLRHYYPDRLDFNYSSTSAQSSVSPDSSNPVFSSHSSPDSLDCHQLPSSYDAPVDTNTSLARQTHTFPTPCELLLDLPSDTPPFPTEIKNEPPRKPHRRPRTQELGDFVSADLRSTLSPTSEPATQSSLAAPQSPDVISSHEKKRHYLECLEYYVQYLHEQLTLVGCQPTVLQRVSSPGRGMTSQSIRTLLVHMENINQALNQDIFAEEQTFLRLRAALSEHMAHNQHHHHRARIV